MVFAVYVVKPGGCRRPFVRAYRAGCGGRPRHWKYIRFRRVEARTKHEAEQRVREEGFEKGYTEPWPRSA